MSPLSRYRGVWICDFGFNQQAGECPSPVCLVARELHSDQTLRFCRDELLATKQAPFSIGPETVVVAFDAPAQLGNFLALGWSLPCRILDLRAEFRCKTSGLDKTAGDGLLGAMIHHGLGRPIFEQSIHHDSTAKRTDEDLFHASESRLDAVQNLLEAMLPAIDFPLALLRGRYTAAVARMESSGIPIDSQALSKIRQQWAGIKDQLVAKVDNDFGIYEGRTFKVARFATWLEKEAISWPRREDGNLAIDDDTFKEMSRVYPKINPIRELRSTLSQLRLENLSVGSDGRNRCPLNPFASKTGRNQPSTSRFVFGPAVWIRSLIRPKKGMAVAYIDWTQQELGIAAALSGDLAMQRAYLSSDFYIEFAKLAGAVPLSATKTSHGDAREQFKVVSLGVLYGLSGAGIARKLNVPLHRGEELLLTHKRTFRRFWDWSDTVQDHAMLTGQLQSVFGWKMNVDSSANLLSVRNFQMQSNGAELMRIACCRVTEQGITVCAPIHDALLIEAPIKRIQEAALITQDAMRKASEIVLDGFALRTDVKIIKYPHRFSDERGQAMWETISGLCGL